MDRYHRFYADPRPGSLLVVTQFPDERSLPALDLRTFDFASMAEHRRYWDMLVERMRFEVARRAAVDDDWIPGIVLHYGFGAFGAVYADVPLVFTDNTSYMGHALTTWAEWEAVRYDPNRFWSQVFIEAGRYISEKADGAFLVDPYPNPSPLDVANLIMGNELFTAFYEQPDRLHRLLDHLTDEAVRNVRTVQAALRNPHGGTLTFNAWIPQGVLLLEDAADLCSPEIYRQFGQPRTARVIAACGGGYIHHHNLGRQQYANMAAIPGLTVLQISGDPNQPRTAANLGYLSSQVGGMPVDTEVTPAEIRDHIGEFTRGRFILRANCSSRDEASDLVAWVRGHSRGHT
ncbi:MAG: hypothetical protein A3K19_32660 [Lentisphaerae bacterium RIFOXYB12_FULL_65_16]|nr:MAG: hypothetical protein A3K18_07905 [Lentisphaerae bacterium RIFOXYA12_64_32]OGV84448.1 MAG: hypothetical protein A3K19_32660 [Lentisphaerae bacterium RIFOXYB12_FULL_65_16]